MTAIEPTAFGKRSGYNDYNMLYHANKLPENPLEQAKFNGPADAVEIAKTASSAANWGMRALMAAMVVAVGFTVISSVVGYSYWNTTLNPFFTTTLATILANITNIFINLTTINVNFNTLNNTVANLAKPNFTLAGDAYSTTFNGSNPQFNTSTPNVGVALNYLANTDNAILLAIAQILATPLATANAFTTTFNGTNPQFNTSTPNVGAALNYLANTDNAILLAIAQILATPPANANAYTTTFNGTNPRFNTSAPNVGVALNYLADNDNALFLAIAQILATPPTNANAFTTTFNGTNPRFNTSASNVGVALNYLADNGNAMQNAINLMQNTLATLTGVLYQNLYMSPAGNDVTCDGSQTKPCASFFRIHQLMPNASNQYYQYNVYLYNGLYVEALFVAFKPNVLYLALEIGTLVVLNGGAGMDGGAWTTTGTGYLSFLRFGLFRCVGACDFDLATAAPSVNTFASVRFYNTTIDLNSGSLRFARPANYSSYYAVTLESTVVVGGTTTFQDITLATWSLTGDCYSVINFNYNTSTTYTNSPPVVTINGLISHYSIAFNNYVPGLTVDVTPLALVLKDSAQLIRNSVSGAFVNFHGDVTSFGVLNGGLNDVGAGSGIKQHLTLDYGLGTIADTPSDWDAPVPDDQHEVNTQLAARLRIQENSIKSAHGYDVTSSSTSTSSGQCEFDVDLNSGTLVETGASQFSPSGGSAIVYNGSASHGFHFTFSGRLDFSLSSPVTTNQMFLLATLYKAGVTVIATDTKLWSYSGFGTSFDNFFAKDVFLNSGDSITLHLTIAIPTSTFSSCSLFTVTSSNHPYFIFNQFV